MQEAKQFIEEKTMKLRSSLRMLCLLLGLSTTQVACSGRIFQGTPGGSGAKKDASKSAADADAKAEAFSTESWQAWLDQYPSEMPFTELYENFLDSVTSKAGDSSFLASGFEFANMQTLLEDILANPELHASLESIVMGDLPRDLDALEIKEGVERVSILSLHYQGEFRAQAETFEDSFGLMPPPSYRPRPRAGQVPVPAPGGVVVVGGQQMNVDDLGPFGMVQVQGAQAQAE